MIASALGIATRMTEFETMSVAGTLSIDVPVRR